MHPSSRAPLGAVLLALLLRALPAPACSLLPPGHIHLHAVGEAGGRLNAEMGLCAGTGPAPPPPADTPPASLREYKAAGLDAWLPTLTVLRYRLDEAADRLLDPEGKPVSAGRLNQLFSPVDASHTRVSALAWQTLQLQGYRVDEASCRFKHPERADVVHADLAMLEEQVQRYLTHSALETLKAGLRGLAPGAPIPPETLQRLRAMEQAQVRLPEELRRALFSGEAVKVSDLTGPLDAAYSASTRFFDGQRPLEGFVIASRPLGSPDSTVPREPGLARPAELRLGALLSADLTRVFGRTGPGREMLDFFRGPRGEGDAVLPELIVLKLSQRPEDSGAGAIYDNEGRRIVFNHWELARIALAQVPEAEREARAREFADPDALRRYLEGHPEARARVVEGLDWMVMHELQHYRQAKAGTLSEEMRRGNVSNTIPLSYEHDAYRVQCRYFLARVADDPSLLARDYGGAWNPVCAAALSDPGVLEQRVTDTYTSGVAGSQTLPELRGLQAVRRDEAVSTLRAWGSSLQDRATAMLKLLGLSHGDRAIEEEDRRERAQLEEHERSVAALRPGLSRVPAALLRQGRPHQALLFLQGAGWEGREDEARAELALAGRLLAARDGRSTLVERLNAANLYLTLAPRLNVTERPAEFAPAYAADLRAMAAELRSHAASATGDMKGELESQARGFESSADSWDPPIRERPAEPAGRPGSGRQQVPRRRAP